MAASDSKVPSWAMLFEGDNYGKRHVTLLSSENITDYRKASSDDGKGGFNNKASSVIYCIAEGLTLRLYKDRNHNGEHCDLTGTGQIERMNFKDENWNNRTSSSQWMNV